MVFSDGVGHGQLLAAERGKPGERYILADGHMTLKELAEKAPVQGGPIGAGAQVNTQGAEGGFGDGLDVGLD